MGTILSDAQCKRIKALNKEFEYYAKRGWMCEGSDKYGPCNCIFNNDTDDIFWADYDGNILEVKYPISGGPKAFLEAMAKIQGDIRKIMEN